MSSLTIGNIIKLLLDKIHEQDLDLPIISHLINYEIIKYNGSVGIIESQPEITQSPKTPSISLESENLDFSQEPQELKEAKTETLKRRIEIPPSISKQEIREMLKEESLKFAKLKRKKIEEADKWDKIDLDVLEKIPKSVRNKMTYFDENEYNDNTVCAYDKRCSVPNCERKHVPICKNGITCPFLETKTCTNGYHFEYCPHGKVCYNGKECKVGKHIWK